MKRHQIIGVIGFIFGILSLALPIYEIRSIIGLSYTQYGFMTDIALNFMILLIAFGILMTRYKKWKPITIFILALIPLIIVSAMVKDINAIVAEMSGEGTVFFNYGPGIFFAFIAPIAFMIGAWLMAREKPAQAG